MMIIMRVRGGWKATAHASTEMPAGMALTAGKWITT